MRRLPPVLYQTATFETRRQSWADGARVNGASSCPASLRSAAASSKQRRLAARHKAHLFQHRPPRVVSSHHSQVVALAGRNRRRHRAPRRLGLRSGSESAVQGLFTQETIYQSWPCKSNENLSRPARFFEYGPEDGPAPALRASKQQNMQRIYTYTLASSRLSGVDQKTGRPQPWAAAMVSTGSMQRSSDPYSSILPAAHGAGGNGQLTQGACGQTGGLGRAGRQAGGRATPCWKVHGECKGLNKATCTLRGVQNQARPAYRCGGRRACV